MADRPTDACKGLRESKEMDPPMVDRPMVDPPIVICYV